MSKLQEGAMTNKASELYELCKKVYELTEWSDTEQYLWIDDSHHATHPEWDTVETATHDMSGKGTPLYTSDYLLEKLPRQIMGKSLEIYGFDEETGMYLVRYDVMDLVPSNQGWYGARADTPLKALLKLTIALSEAGELK